MEKLDTKISQPIYDESNAEADYYEMVPPALSEQAKEFYKYDNIEELITNIPDYEAVIGAIENYNEGYAKDLQEYIEKISEEIDIDPTNKASMPGITDEES